MGLLKEARLDQLPRDSNSEADALAKLGSQKDATLLGVIPLEIQKYPSVSEAELMLVDTTKVDTWMMPI